MNDAAPESAFVLALKPHGENAAILTAFTQESGLKRGLVRGVKKKMTFLQPGNKIRLTHSRRLSHQLGTFSAEPETDYATACMMNGAMLTTLAYVSELLARTLPEEQSMANVFDLTQRFLVALKEEQSDGLWQKLAFFELSLLAAMGYGLSLSHKTGAVSCPKDTPLMYVSPKSGRAVSQDMGAPYADKLFPLPALFGGPEMDEKEDMHNTFSLTGYFLDQLLPDTKLESRMRALQALMG